MTVDRSCDGLVKYFNDKFTHFKNTNQGWNLNTIMEAVKHEIERNYEYVNRIHNFNIKFIDTPIFNDFMNWYRETVANNTVSRQLPYINEIPEWW